MTQAQVLALPNFDDEFVVETDASGLGMGAVLCQKGHPICYFSKKFCPRMLNASTYVRELCAITTAVKKWRKYLLGKKFTIHTDQRSLRELMTQVVQTPEQQFYLAKLLGYSYEILYKPGTQNRVADALSRLHETSPQLMIITIPHWELVQKLQNSFSSDPDLQSLIQRVQNDPTAYPHFKVLNGILYFKDKLYIPSTSPLKSALLEEFHSSQLGGHSGINKTYGRLQENVHWVGMKEDVTSYVNSCIIC